LHVSAENNADYARFLILMPAGIGDAVAVGLSAVDQLIQNDPAAYGKIDVVCNDLQADIFRYDPRIHEIIYVDRPLFPTPDIKTWIRGTILGPDARKLRQFLRNRAYEGVFPGNSTPVFYRGLHTRIMNISLLKFLQDFLSLRSSADVPIGKITRQAINAYFGNQLPEPAINEAIPMYVHAQYLQKATRTFESLREMSGIPREDCRVMVIAPDTSSVITRPPTHLLAEGVSAALQRRPDVLVYILPGYSDVHAAENIYKALTPYFDRRIFMLPGEPRPPLLEITMLIDQADVFITGDTGTMHLAVTTRKLKEGEDASFSPKNSMNTIALFGGTNPGLHGYSRQTIILGRGRKEQKYLTPGIFKEAYFLKMHDFFDHISPQQLTNAILQQLQ
jgi:ADP-heptose:LPS heptosyltransferase